MPLYGKPSLALSFIILLYQVYIGIGSWALSWSWHSIFTATASFQATRLKIRYFEAGNAVHNHQ